MNELLAQALQTGDDRALRDHLQAASGLPGPRLNLRLVQEFAAAVGAVITAEPDPPVAELEALLDGWAALGETAAPGDQPAVVLPCAAVAAYGEAARVRPGWWPDEVAKLRRAATDGRWRVRELVAAALQRVLAVDWDRTAAELERWARDPDPLVVRAAAAAVAEPPLLNEPSRHQTATAIQRAAVASLTSVPQARRAGDPARILRKALGFTISVVAAASRDLTLIDELAASDDPDLRWVAAENLRKARLRALRPAPMLGPSQER